MLLTGLPESTLVSLCHVFQDHKGILWQDWEYLTSYSNAFQVQTHGSRGLINKIYGPLRGILTTIIDFLSRLLLLTLKSMAVNIHLIVTVRRPSTPGKNCKHCSLTSSYGLGKQSTEDHVLRGPKALPGVMGPVPQYSETYFTKNASTS